jgi:hypothetical protein
MSSGNHLTVQRSQLTTSEVPEDDEYGYSFICRTCPYEFVVDKEYYNRRLSRVKLVDDIMGGASAWENVDQTAGILLLFPFPPAASVGCACIGIVLCAARMEADDSAHVSE